MMYSLYILLSLPILALIFRKQIRKWAKGGQCNIEKDLTGKVVVITGSNTGIGYETAKKLALCNATVILACRNLDRGNKAKIQLIQETKNKNIHFHKLDLASIKSIEVFAETIKYNFKRLDILVNNAGVMFITNKQLTNDGFEMQVGVNHIGHFHLTNELMDLIQNTADLQKKEEKNCHGVRVVTVSSIAYMQNFGKIEWSNYMATKSYSMKT